MKLSTEQNEIILKNRKLVNTIAYKYCSKFNELDDLISIGTLGLINAVLKYDINKTDDFKKIASTCIKNAIFKYFHSNRKNRLNVFIQEVLVTSDTGNEFIVGDTIPNNSVRKFDDIIINNEILNKILNIALNCLSTREKIILLYKVSDISHPCICKIYNISQTTVTRILNKSIENIKEILATNREYHSIYKLNFVHNECQMEFSLSDINRDIETLLLNINKVLKLAKSQKIKFNNVNESARIVIPTDECEYLMIIAEIIKQIEYETKTLEKDIYQFLTEYEECKKITSFEKSRRTSAKIITHGNKSLETLLSFINIDVDKSIKKIDEITIKNLKICKILNIVLNCISYKEKIILLYQMDNIQQICIGKIFNISRSSVASILRNTINKTKEFANENIDYNKIYEVKLVDEKLKISFLLDNINIFNKEIETLLLNIKKSLDSTESKMICTSKSVEIYLPMEGGYFKTITEIINQIECDSKIELGDINKIIEEHQKLLEYKISKKKPPISLEIREYIFKLGSFTLCEIKEKFPESYSRAIDYVISNAKGEGKIEIISSNKYRVIHK